MGHPPTRAPAGRFKSGQSVWLTRNQEAGAALHYPCHVLGYNALTGLYSLARADERNRHTFADASAITPRRKGEIAPGIKPKTRREAEIVELRR